MSPSTFDHQIKHLLGVIDRTQRSIDESVEIIARNNQQSETLRENVKAYRQFIEDTQAAIRVLEGSDGG
jgi:peptidoglycan hydrolase CwlO-like protein